MSPAVRAALAVAMVTGLVSATGPVAAETGEASRAAAPVILDLADGAVLDEPLTSVRIDFTGVEPGVWLVGNTNDVRGECGNVACIGDTFVRVAAGDGVRRVVLDTPLDHEGAYRLYVQDDRTSPTPGATDEASFTLTSDVTYADVQQERPTFAPDGDGVDDTTVLRFATSGSAGRPVARVLAPPNSGGVADAAVTGNAYDGWTVTWDGRFLGGDTAFGGDYLIAVDTPDTNGVTARLERGVTVGPVEPTPATGTARVAGDAAGVVTASGRCIARTPAPGRQRLACGGGRGSASALYVVRIPEGSSVDRFWVRAVTSAAAGAGRVERRLQWVGRRRAAVRVSVTGDAVTTVREVAVRWRLPASR